MLKRGFDIVASGVALVALLPLMLVLAILVRLDSPGPQVPQHEKRELRHGGYVWARCKDYESRCISSGLQVG
jgi:hypothetical protein